MPVPIDELQQQYQFPLPLLQIKSFCFQRIMFRYNVFALRKIKHFILPLHHLRHGDKPRILSPASTGKEFAITKQIGASHLHILLYLTIKDFSYDHSFKNIFYFLFTINRYLPEPTEILYFALVLSKSFSPLIFFPFKKISEIWLPGKYTVASVFAGISTFNSKLVFGLLPIRNNHSVWRPVGCFCRSNISNSLRCDNYFFEGRHAIILTDATQPAI